MNKSNCQGRLGCHGVHNNGLTRVSHRSQPGLPDREVGSGVGAEARRTPLSFWGGACPGCQEALSLWELDFYFFFLNPECSQKVSAMLKCKQAHMNSSSSLPVRGTCSQGLHQQEEERGEDIKPVLRRRWRGNGMFQKFLQQRALTLDQWDQSYLRPSSHPPYLLSHPLKAGGFSSPQL